MCSAFMRIYPAHPHVGGEHADAGPSLIAPSGLPTVSDLVRNEGVEATILDTDKIC